jgi:hypothetical protein
MWFKLKQIWNFKSIWNNPIGNWQQSLLTQATKQPSATVGTWAKAKHTRPSRQPLASPCHRARLEHAQSMRIALPVRIGTRSRWPGARLGRLLSGLSVAEQRNQHWENGLGGSAITLLHRNLLKMARKGCNALKFCESSNPFLIQNKPWFQNQNSNRIFINSKILLFLWAEPPPSPL